MLTWKSIGRGSADSVPIGNGHWGANVWPEADGSVCIYTGATDSWSENGRLLKVARIRFSPGTGFDATALGHRLRFELDEQHATARLITDDGVRRRTVSVWIDAHRDILWIEAEGDTEATLAFEPWRTSPRYVTEEWELHSFIGQAPGPDGIRVGVDERVIRSRYVGVTHENGGSVVPVTLDHQGLGDCTGLVDDQLAGRISGALAGFADPAGVEVLADGPALCAKAPGGRFLAAVALATGKFGSVDHWAASAEGDLEVVLSEARNRGNDPASKGRHDTWWDEFWNRSFIELSGDDDAEHVGEAYRFHRYLIACGGRGPHPVKFNGSIFTFDGNGEGHTWDADFRRWGGGYWFQNTRLVYWSLLASGDFEMIRPFADMYLSALPLARERTKRYFGHAGVFFPETMTLWGTYLNSNYGFDREGREVSWVQNTFIRRYWVGALELVAFLVDYYLYSRDQAVLIDYLLPIAGEVIAFYIEHYPNRSASKTVIFEPAQSLETWHDATNPLPEIAGCRYVLERLLRIVESSTAAAGCDLDGWRRFADELPEIPKRGYRYQKRSELLPADRYDDNANTENPALYAVFPFRLYGVGKPDIETGRCTYERRQYDHLGGWSQDGIQAALLGMTDEARRCVAYHARSKNAGSRFPAFWGPNFDWIPDMDHGSVVMIALQRMLLQSEPGRIDIAPAWPREWNVSFRLRAHGGVTVEGDIEGGSVQYLDVDTAAGEAAPETVNHLE